MRRLRNGLRARAAVFVLGAMLFGVANAQVALPPAVETAPLAKDTFATGMLTRADGALDPTLWRGADPATLNFLLDAAPARPSGPSLGEVLRRVLLTSGETPQGATSALGGRKLLALSRAGFIEETRTVASISNASRTDPWVNEALAVADLLDGDTPNACRRSTGLSARQDTPFWMKLRLLCFAAAGQRDAADLTLTVLREQGALDGVDETLLPALAIGASPKTPVAPRNALQYAAVRAMGLPLTPGLIGEADGGVLAAIAEEPGLDPATRITAASRAVAMGAISAAQLQVLYEGVKIEAADLGRASDIARERPNDPLTDVILFQSIRQMTAPEFLRDKASRISLALSIADSFPRAYAASLLYSEDIVALEGALLTAEEAAQFALARMAVGDGDGAARWLFAALGVGGVSALGEDKAMSMIELVNLLSVLDPISAAAVAEAAKIDLGAPHPVGPSPRDPAALIDDAAVARVVNAAFDAAIEEIPGQAALAALAMSELAAPDDAVAAAVVDQSLRAAGFNELRRRMDFERAWRATFAPETLRSAMDAAAGAEADAAPAATAPPPRGEGGLLPRLKPRSSP